MFQHGYPVLGDGEAIPLAVSPGPKANAYLRELARANGRHRQGIDLEGWLRIATGPMEGWPARQVIEAMLDTPALVGLVHRDVHPGVADRLP